MPHIWSRILFQLFWAAVLICSGISLLRADDSLRAGVAKRDITPSAPVMLAGYESRKDPSHGVHDPLSARALAFERDGKHLVLVSLDSLGFYNQTAEPLRSAILESCNLQPSELFLAAIHTHSAPTLTLDPVKGYSNNVAYTLALKTQLVQVVRQALDKTLLVKIQVGIGSSPVGANRREVSRDPDGNPRIILGRNPSIPIDRQVQVLQISEAQSDSRLAVLFDYGTHSTSLGPHNYLISGDVHGLAAQFVEQYLGNGTVAPEFAGASGNIDPWYRVLPEFRATNGWIPEPVLLGTMLGEEVVHVTENMSKEDAGGRITTLFKTLALRGKPPDEQLTATNCPPTPLNLTVGRIGQVAFVGLGGEVFNEIGLAIKSASPFPYTIVITHCNGAAGYLPIRSAYLEGGYEVKSSRFAPDAADEVIQEALRMLRLISAGE